MNASFKQSISQKINLIKQTLINPLKPVKPLEDSLAEDVTDYIFYKYNLIHTNQKHQKVLDITKDTIKDMYDKDNFLAYISDYISSFFDDVDMQRLNAEFDHLYDMENNFL